MAPRDLVLNLLNRAEQSRGLKDGYLDICLAENPGFSQRDRAFVVHLFQGVIRWRIRLDWIIGQAVRFPFSKIEPTVLNILRLALYQILLMDRVPDSAAVNEAVKQVKGLGRTHLTGFVNGVLRRICREKEEISFPDPVREPVRYLSAFYSYPVWLVEKWIGELGHDAAERLLDSGNRIPKMVLRTNTLKTDRPGLIEAVEREGVSCSPTSRSPEGVVLDGLNGPVNDLEAFKRGLFQVQGEAAQIGSHLLCPGPGERVLDLCAGMGGKSTHLSALMKNRGLVVSLDRSRPRLERLFESSARLGTDRVCPVVADGTGPLSRLFTRPFDRILVDAPCSGLGVIARRPDIKMAKGPEDIRRLAGLQLRILNQGAALLIKGGRMLYLTCTVSRQENEGEVEAFLKANPMMGLEDLGDTLPEWGRDLIDENGLFRTFPHVHGMEGFFGALFTRR